MRSANRIKCSSPRLRWGSWESWRRWRRCRRWRRSGMGVAFVIVMVVLVFLALVGLGVKYFTQGATRLGESVLSSEKAVHIGRAAIEETWAYLETRVNDPEHPLFERSREHCHSDSSPWGFQFSPYQTRSLYSDDSNISIGDVEVSLPREFRIWHRNQLEKFGHVGLHVQVEIYIPALGRTVSRELTQWREYKVLYPSPPRPFAGMTLFVLLPEYLFY